MSKSTLQRRAEIQGLGTAILLPSVGVFGGPIGSQAGDVGPLTNVVGIGLFQRAVLTLQRGGIRQLIVLSGSEEEQLKQALGKGPRVTIPVHYVFGERDALTPPSLVDKIPSRIAAPGSTVVYVPNAGHHVHFDHPDVVRSIIAKA